MNNNLPGWCQVISRHPNPLYFQDIPGQDIPGILLMVVLCLVPAGVAQDFQEFA